MANDTEEERNKNYNNYRKLSGTWNIQSASVTTRLHRVLRSTQPTQRSFSVLMKHSRRPLRQAEQAEDAFAEEDMSRRARRWYRLETETFGMVRKTCRNRFNMRGSPIFITKKRRLSGRQP